MNPLTHAHFALELFKDHQLSQDEKDHLIVGSIIPDISQLGLINFYQTHTRGLKLLQHAKDPLLRYLAIGIVLHGEEPHGLDYHAHKKGGYIETKNQPIIKIIKKYRKHIGKVDNSLAHYVTEFSLDHIVAKRDPALIKKVNLAFMNSKINKTVLKFFHFFNVPERKAEKAEKFLNNKHLYQFFSNAQTLQGLAKNWVNINFYRNLKHGRNQPFIEKVRKLTKLSYFNLRRKIQNDPLIKMFYETSEYLGEDYHHFVAQTQKQLTPLKNELLTYCSKKR